MKTILKCIIPIAALLLISCSDDSQNDLIEEEVVEVDEETPLTYNANIRSIINNNCIACHSDPTQNGAPFPLANYDQVLVRAQNGQLFGAITKQTGQSGAMPPSGRMPQTTIDLIKQWIDEGALED